MIRTRRSSGRVALALVLGLVPTAAASAASKRTTQQAQAHATHAAILSQLHHAHSLLVHADHDYKGHRAKAAHHVAAAIHAMTGTHHHHAQHPARRAGAPKIPQAQSDAHLRQAAQILATTSTKMTAGHKSTSHVSHAVTEIGTALKAK